MQAEAGAAEGDAANGGRGEEIIKDPDQFQDPEDESNIFAGTVYEQDDEEADRVWESVDERLDERRKRRREETEAEQLKAFRAAQPKIQTQCVRLSFRRSMRRLRQLNRSPFPLSDSPT